MAQPKRRERLSIRTAGRASTPDQEAKQAPVLEEGDNPDVRLVRERIEKILTEIGTDAMPETKLPESMRNNGAEANEYALTDMVKKILDKRAKAAKEAAEKAGVFGDPEKYIEGDTVMVWQAPHLAISVKKGNPSKMIGKEETQAALERHLGKKATEVMEECMKPREANTQIIVSLK